MLHAELWVHRKSTFNGLVSVTLASFKLASFTNSFWHDFADFPLATVLGEIRQNRIHADVLSPINQVAATSLLRYQICVHQFFQMKRQRVRGHAQQRCNQRLCEPFMPLYHQRKEYLEAVVLSQRYNCFNDLFMFHNSTLMKIYDCLMSMIDESEFSSRLHILCTHSIKQVVFW